MSSNNSFEGGTTIHPAELPLFVYPPNENTDSISYIILMSIIALPFIMTDIYFANTHTTCVTQRGDNDRMDLNLREYLLVSGFTGIIGIIGAIIGAYYDSIIIAPKLFPILKKIYILFQLMWTCIGGIVFWGIIDNKYCNNGIYTYVSSLLILKFLWFAHTFTQMTFN